MKWNEVNWRGKHFKLFQNIINIEFTNLKGKYCPHRQISTTLPEDYVFAPFLSLGHEQL